MEHYDWNEYHADLMARRQAEAQKQAGQQDAGAAQQSGAPQQAAGAQPAPQQAASTQPAPQPATTARPAPEPAPGPIETEPQDEPPTSWNYGSSSYAAPQYAAQSTQESTYQGNAYESTASQSTNKKKGHTGRTILIVVIVVLIVAVIALIAVFALNSSSSSSSGTDSAETSSVTSDSLQGMVDSLDWMAPMAATTDDDSYDDEDEEEDTSSSSYDSIDEFLESYGTFEEVTVTGTGSETFDLPVDDIPMLITFEFEGSGEDSYFIVRTLDADDEIIDIFSGDISDTTYFGVWTNVSFDGFEEGATQVDVSAYGDWTITFSPMSSMETLENGKTYSGTGVYRIDADELSGLTVNYAPEDDDSSFGLTIISPDDGMFRFVYDGESLTDEVYEWTDPVCYVFVECDDSEWSISW